MVPNQPSFGVARFGAVLASMWLLCGGCGGRDAAPAVSVQCGVLGPRDAPREQLLVLGCVTALAGVAGEGAAAHRALAERGLREVYEDLQKRTLSQEELSYWAELYRLSAQLHPQELSVGDIPLTVVNAHNFSVPFWVRHAQKSPLGTLVHFDTHADMDDVPRPESVQSAVADIRAGQNLERSWHVLSHAVYRNSMPVTAAVLAAGVRELFWAKPTWARDPLDFSGKSFFFARPRGANDPGCAAGLDSRALSVFFRTAGSDSFALHYDAADNGGVWLPRRELELGIWRAVAPSQQPHDAHFEVKTPVRFSALTTDRPLSTLVSAVPAERFVLDIDLDYFVNIGHDVEPSDDPPSPGQRLLGSFSALTGYRSRARGGDLSGTLVAAERQVIRGRIDRFRAILRALSKAGKRPSVISIADSTYLPFAGKPSGEEHAAFVPVHHAYWVREQVLAVVQEVFGGGKVAPEVAPQPIPSLGRVVPPTRAEPLTPVVALLGRVLVSALGAAPAMSKSPRLSKVLLLFHALASHAPEVRLRRAARAAANFVGRSLSPAELLPVATVDPVENREVKLRIAFGRRYGASEAQLAELGAAWLREGDAGPGPAPDLDADAAPTSKVQMLAEMGLGPDALGPLATISDFASSLLANEFVELPAQSALLPRVMLGLQVARCLLSLHPTAPLPEVTPASPELPRPARIEEALLRAAVWVISWLGAEPTYSDLLAALPLLESLGRRGADSAAGWLARLGAERLGTRALPRLEALAATAGEELLLRLGGGALALESLGVKATRLRDAVLTRARALPATAPETPTFGTAGRSLWRAHARERLGLGGQPLASVLRALATVFSALSPTAADDLAKEQLDAILALLGTTSDAGRSRLDRTLFAREWSLLETLQYEVLASGRSDLVAPLLLGRRVAGDGATSRPVANLEEQLLADQRAAGSWGTAEDAVATTAVVVTALVSAPGASTPVSTRAQEAIRALPRGLAFDAKALVPPEEAGRLFRR